MTSPEEKVSPPEWLIKLEKKEKPHRLAHEIGAGSPCLNCEDKCPGLDLHFWRKLCRNCKCKKEDHDIIDDVSYTHFNILFGSSTSKNSFIRPKRAVLELLLKNGKEKSVPFDWTPPNVTSDLVKEYLERLPQSKLPISNSPGAKYRRQQLEKQIPLHDFDSKLCHELTSVEAKELEEYATNVKNSVVGQARLVRIPVVKGFTSSSTEIESARPFKSLNLISGNEKYRDTPSSSIHGFNFEKSGPNRNEDCPHITSEENINKTSQKDRTFDVNYDVLCQPNSLKEFSKKISEQKPHFSQHINLPNSKNFVNRGVGEFSLLTKPESFTEFSEPLDDKAICGMTARASSKTSSTHLKPTFDISFATVNTNLEGHDNNYLENEMLTNNAEFNMNSDSNKNHASGGIETHFSTLKNYPFSSLEYSLNQEMVKPYFSRKLDQLSEKRQNLKTVPNMECLISGDSDKIINKSALENCLNNELGRVPQSKTNFNLDLNKKGFQSKNSDFGKDNEIKSQYGKGNLQGKDALSGRHENLDSETEKMLHNLTELSINESIKCTQCEKVIDVGGIAIVVQKKQKTKAWHPECFICSECEELLVDLLYFHYKGKVYCGRDYAKLCGIPRCYACDELIFLKSYTQAEGQSFHLRHFCCLECDVPLEDEQYLPKDGHPICLPCYNKYYAKHCHTCVDIIAATEKTIRWNELSWHANENCFACFYCKKSLLNSKFTLKNEQPFCSQTCVRSMSYK